MTATISQPPALLPSPSLAPTSIPTLTPKPSWFARFKPRPSWLNHRWLQLPMLLGIAGALAYDRYTLARDYLFKYTDEDQAIMWYAAHDILKGRLPEPGFYGQDYNTCIEGLLAAPLVAAGMPYHIACPLVTLILGLLPFLVLAWVAWRRGHSLLAATALLVPLLMPHRYSMITGIPRGFVTGLAVAIFPAALLLPPPERKSDKSRPRLARSWPVLRYFFAAALSVIAFQVNPSCALLLAPVAVYALFTSWREPRFWLAGAAGLIAAAPLVIYFYQFYYIYHPDYPLYLRNTKFDWGFNFYTAYLAQYIYSRPGRPSPILSDLVPFDVPGQFAPEITVYAFSALALLLLLRARIAGLAAIFSAALITLVSFGYERVRTDPRTANTASFAFSRMYLALPILFVWLIFLVNHKPIPLFNRTTLGNWFTRCALAGLLIAAIHVATLKQATLAKAINAEVNAPGSVVCPAMPIERIYATAADVKKAMDASHADFIIVAGGDRQKNFAYALPALLDIETMYPDFERRTWRMIEEYNAHHQAILAINFPMPGATPIAGGAVVTLDDDGNILRTVSPNRPGQPPSPPPATLPANIKTHTIVTPIVMMLKTDGKNAYQYPDLKSRLPRVVFPQPKPDNPTPGPQVYRPNW